MSTIGNASTHSAFAWHMIAVFRNLCQRSTSPFDSEWYAVVLARLVPKSLVKASNRFDSNCDPWSVVMIFDEPKRDIHVVKKVFATVSAVMSVSGR